MFHETNKNLKFAWNFLWQIYDGTDTDSPEIDVLCGQKDNIIFYNSTGHSMTLHFTTNSGGNNKGFMAEFFTGEI